MQQHWDEVQPDGPDVKFDPDWDGFFLLERSGRLAVYTARDAGVLVGYVSSVVAPRLHRKGYVEAIVDGVFLSSPYRLGWNGFKLLRGAERGLKARNVQEMRILAPEYLGPIMKRLGYSGGQRQWNKRL